MASDVVMLDEAKTLQGQAVRIDASSGVKINTARVVKADVAAENGVIHVIDEVLLPPSPKQGNAASPSRGLIEHAIKRGAPLYNDGHHAACTAIYEVAAMGLLASSDATLGKEARSALNDALVAVQRSHDVTKNAWTMRNALDEVYMSAID
jgi:transcriptional regulator GlxA family with amidase domain